MKPMDEASEPNVQSSRRAFVACALSGVPAVALLSACGGTAMVSNSGTPGAGGAVNGGGTAGNEAGGGSGGSAGSCTLYPQQTEGPFFLDLALTRSDIKDGKTGTPMTLIIEVWSAASCAPVPGALVDVWHCDADGVYSGFPNQLGDLDTTGEQFLRGAQITDAAGLASFESIYPGWYPGRTTHIHFKVRPTSSTEATSQLYFPEEVSALVYQSGAYAAHGPKDTTNAADSIGRNTPLAEVSQAGDGYEVRLTVTLA